MDAVLNFKSRRATQLVLQTEGAECGLACLAMVAGHHGFEIDLASLRRRHPISMKGATLADLMVLAGQLRMNVRPIKVELDDLSRVTLPAILHWDFNHFVVLTKAQGDRVVILDPAQGERHIRLAEVSERFTGVCLELSPAQDFQPRVERQRVSLLDLMGRFRGMRGTIGQVLGMALALEVFAIVSPFFMQLVVDQAVVSGDRDLLSVLGIGFLLAALVHVAIAAARAWVLMVLGTTVNAQMATNLFAHLLRLPMDFFEKRHLGDVASRFESLSVIQRTLTSSFVEAVIDGLMAAITIVVMFVYSAKLAAIACLAAALYTLLRVLLYKPLRIAQQEQIAHSASQQTNFLETVRGIQSVKLFSRQDQRRTTQQNLLVNAFNAGIRGQRLEIAYNALKGALFGAENIAVVWLGALLVLDGGFTVGMLFAFVAFKQTFMTRTGAFVDKAIEFHMLGLHAERVSDIALTAQEPDSHSEDISGLSADVELRNVVFRYSEFEAPVLDGINLRVEEGESVAIVGPSGCGKTTLLKLILGLLAPTEGEVLIGGKSLSRLGSAHRGMIGTVMQDDDLFAGSLSENICFFDPEPQHEWIKECAKLAAIHQDIIAMPMGYNTLVGDMGAALSGGQKQRVLLARALYKRPRILALDEATSHLDVVCERAVNEAVRALRLTRVIIAHRPETIGMAGRVIALPDHANGPPSRILAGAA